MPLFKQVRYLNDRKNSKIGAVNFISGLMLEEKTAQLDRWKGHLAKPLNARRLVINPNLTACAQQTTDKNLLELIPSVEEIQKKTQKEGNTIRLQESMGRTSSY